ncbi:MAG: acyltransferase family protein [Aureispira sp.]|nr:acyltransferase family protein [Aureispira sp.]
MNSKTERIHSLDALRAIMMLLGVVFHSAISYCVYDQGRTWPLKDVGSTSLGIDYIVGYIHIFRMPIFFVVAGFFGALLFYERSPIFMLKNRVNRLLLPFIVFVILLWPILGSSYLYTYEAFSGSPLPEASEPFHLGLLIPQSSFHLWFLQYLFMISGLVVCVALFFKQIPTFATKLSKLTSKVLNNVLLKILLSTLVLFTILLLMNEAWVDTTNYFIPNWKTMLFYTTFYIFGWLLYASKKDLATFMAYDWLLFVSSLILFALVLFNKEALSITMTMLLNALMVSLCLFSITGLFIRYFSKSSSKMRYISDASYWVYIIHMPITLAGPGFLVTFLWSPFLKFFCLSLVTTLIAFISYHYCVRSTFIGKFLNGRVHPKSSLKEVWPAEPVNPIEVPEPPYEG